MRKILLPILILILFVTGCGGKEAAELPEISQEAIDLAVQSITQDNKIKDAAINIEDNTISLAVITDNMNENEAKETADSFVRLLGTFTANDQLKGPSNESYGDIYNHYNVVVGVYTSAQKTIVQGAKAKGSKNITW